jgi:hypothetical protein
MMSWFKIRAAVLAAPVFVCAVAASPQAFAAAVYSQGFETNTFDWTGVNRVASGSNGITSASGSFHAEATGNGTSYSYWGGINASTGGTPGAFVPYTTSLDIYLNVGGGFANNTRFDFDSAISQSDASNTFLRDFVFNGGFYNDATGPGAGTDRFVFSASTNSQPGSAYAKNPARDPIAISTSGWYTFQQQFVDNAGTLAVVMTILDSGGDLVHQWTLSNPGDLTATVVGGSRYGWIDFNEFGFLAIDNASLAINEAVVTPLPAALPMFASGLGVFGVLRWRKKRKAATA